MTLLDLTEGQFQSAWYYSIVVAAMVALVLTGCGWALRGAVRVWRSGDHAAGSAIAAGSLTGTAILIGLLIAGAVGLHGMVQGG